MKSKPKPKKRLWLRWILGVLAFIILTSGYLLLTSPYNRYTIVQPPFTTSYVDGHVTLTQNYKPHVYSGWWADIIGFYKQAVSIVWSRYSQAKIPANSEEAIIAAIHAERFDPSKPYVISGDQFDGLYLRNMGVFYQDLLNKQAVLNDTDWHNRQRIAVQTVAYGLEAITQLQKPVTTLLPISPRDILAINVYSYPSDTLFSMMTTLDKLEADPATHQVSLDLRRNYGAGLKKAYEHYLATVRDPQTGFVRTDVALASARDAVKRQSSFYDNIILWRTRQLATKLGLDSVSDVELSQTKQAILLKYWDDTQGHFIDDVAVGHEHSYSSDWLIALPIGFLQPANPDDLAKLVKISAYIDTTHLTDPLPIRYSEDANSQNENIFVKLFVGSYGNTAIWSYWGDQYIAMQIVLYQQANQPIYAEHVRSALAGWQKVIVRDKGYPETLDAAGRMLETPAYKSILRNGWVVGFEVEELHWKQIEAKR
jgi:hypothetical protein